MCHRQFLACVSIAISVKAQQADIRTSSTEVILDLIVRDKSGRPAKDVAPADVSIQENGKTFWPSAMRLITSNIAELGEPTGTPTLTDALRQVCLVAFLFEPLPRESAPLHL